jgi:hypothetical protein
VCRHTLAGPLEVLNPVGLGVIVATRTSCVMVHFVQQPGQDPLSTVLPISDVESFASDILIPSSGIGENGET